MTSELHTLFQNYSLTNSLTLKNRIIMAPMTRNMADDNFVPTNAMADYYERRADAGLIITEGTMISPDARGYTNTPGIFTQEQINAWRKVTTKVHQRNGRIFLQIWHVGRVSHPYFLNGQLPISASATELTGRIRRIENLQYGKSRAATLNEINHIIEDYVNAAKNAMAAGFDGVEIHGANGYLIDQFLHYHTNHRTDKYGGPPENMARFALEVVESVGAAIGIEKVGLRISPGGYLNDIQGDPRDAEVFKHLFTTLNLINLAYVHTGNFDDAVKFDALDNLTMTAFIRKYYSGTLIACGSYQFTKVGKSIENNEFDLIGIGRPFIANPDLISRLQTNEKLNAYDQSMLQILN